MPFQSSLVEGCRLPVHMKGTNDWRKHFSLRLGRVGLHSKGHELVESIRVSAFIFQYHVLIQCRAALFSYQFSLNVFLPLVAELKAELRMLLAIPCPFKCGPTIMAIYNTTYLFLF